MVRLQLPSLIGGGSVTAAQRPCLNSLSGEATGLHPVVMGVQVPLQAPIMKCCTCSKIIDLKQGLNSNSEPLWFGKYRNEVLIKVICSECFKDVSRKQKYLEKD